MVLSNPFNTVVEYDIHRSSRHCSETGRELQAGEPFFSVLRSTEGQIVRQDFAPESWQGPPSDAIGWWKSQVPSPSAKRMQWAPNEVMLQLFDDLEVQPDREAMRFVLGLLLVRRRVMRLEATETDDSGAEFVVLSCPRRQAEYRVPVNNPSPEQTQAIQAELSQLLFGGGSETTLDSGFPAAE